MAGHVVARLADGEYQVLDIAGQDRDVRPRQAVEEAGELVLGGLCHAVLVVEDLQHALDGSCGGDDRLLEVLRRARSPLAQRALEVVTRAAPQTRISQRE
jgi:hypothetical protein